jgi:DUF971 family protein
LAGKKRKKNRYKIVDDYIVVYLDRRDGTVLETLIDLDDFDKVLNYEFKWFAKYNLNTDSYYVYSTIYKYTPEGKKFNSTVKLNKYVLDYTGNKEIDHKNHDTLDNRKFNLRVSEYADNSKHRKGKNKNNSTGYRNVSMRNGKPIVQLQVDGKNRVWSGFKDIHEAGLFARTKREEVYGEYCGGD